MISLLTLKFKIKSQNGCHRKKHRWNQRFLRYFKESKNSDLRGCHPYKRVSLPKNRYFLLQR